MRHKMRDANSCTEANFWNSGENGLQAVAVGAYASRCLSDKRRHLSRSYRKIIMVEV